MLVLMTFTHLPRAFVCHRPASSSVAKKSADRFTVAVIYGIARLFGRVLPKRKSAPQPPERAWSVHVRANNRGPELITGGVQVEPIGLKKLRARFSVGIEHRREDVDKLEVPPL